MEKKLLLPKDPNVCINKPLFDFLQRKELRFLDPINVSKLVDLSFSDDVLQSAYLCNQVIDPNLGIHYRLEIKDQNVAKFKWVVIDSKIFPIKKFCNFEEEKLFEPLNFVADDAEISAIKDFNEDINYSSDVENEDLSEVELWQVMNNAFNQGKLITYFIAEGNYDGVDGIHFCLTPFNDLVSCEVLKTLFGENLVEKFHNFEFKDEIETSDFDLENIDLDKYFNPDAVEYCNYLCVDHFKENLGDLIIGPMSD